MSYIRLTYNDKILYIKLYDNKIPDLFIENYKPTPTKEYLDPNYEKGPCLPDDGQVGSYISLQVASRQSSIRINGG